MLIFLRFFFGLLLIAVGGIAISAIRSAHPELTEMEVFWTYWPRYVFPAILILVGGLLASR
ncbi:MAG: hypothetical protein HOP18_16155 [Deltaproteobacteria bacterium]|nr:hypothetical protein [Deltaproteobacteria bacterium]